MPLFSCAQPPTAFPSIAALFRLWTDSSRLAVYSVWLVSVGGVLLRLPLARMGPPDPALGSRRASEKPFSFCLLCILVTVRAYILLGIGKNECFPFPRCLLDGFGLLCWDKQDPSFRVSLIRLARANYWNGFVETCDFDICGKMKEEWDAQPKLIRVLRQTTAHAPRNQELKQAQNGGGDDEILVRQQKHTTTSRDGGWCHEFPCIVFLRVVWFFNQTSSIHDSFGQIQLIGSRYV